MSDNIHGVINTILAHSTYLLNVIHCYFITTHFHIMSLSKIHRIAPQQSTIIATSLNLKGLETHQKEKLLTIEDKVFYS